MSEKRLIKAQRCHDEGLAFEEYTIMITDDGVNHVRAKITDAAGVVYDAMLCEDSALLLVVVRAIQRDHARCEW
jgi:hypothetical protein